MSFLCGNPSGKWLPHIEFNEFTYPSTIWNKSSASYALAKEFHVCVLAAKHKCSGSWTKCVELLQIHSTQFKFKPERNIQEDLCGLFMRVHLLHDGVFRRTWLYDELLMLIWMGSYPILC